MLKYDGKILRGTINGNEVKVIRSSDDTEDLEKACMMALLKSLGYTYEDIQELYHSVERIWRPKYREKYYFIADNLQVNYTWDEDFTSDRSRINAGNCFKTKEDAQQKLNSIKELF